MREFHFTGQGRLSGIGLAANFDRSEWELGDHVLDLKRWGAESFGFQVSGALVVRSGFVQVGDRRSGRQQLGDEKSQSIRERQNQETP